MSIFEIIMLLCFGLAWPFSIFKAWRTRTNGSKSFIFLCAILIGYITGILHKIFYNMDGVIFFYSLNGLMVATDIVLYLRNFLYHNNLSPREALRILFSIDSSLAKEEGK